MSPNELVNALIRKQGKDEARRIVAETLKAAQVSNDLFLFSDAEWSMGTKGLEMSKNNRRSGAKEKREKKNLAFWLQIDNIIKKL